MSQYDLFLPLLMFNLLMNIVKFCYFICHLYERLWAAFYQRQCTSVSFLKRILSQTTWAASLINFKRTGCTSLTQSIYRHKPQISTECNKAWRRKELLLLDQLIRIEKMFWKWKFQCQVPLCLRLSFPNYSTKTYSTASKRRVANKLSSSPTLH